MARTKDNTILHALRGKIGNQIVVKQYGDKTVITKYPDMSHLKPTPLQQKYRNDFAEAVAYARKINNNPREKEKYLEKIEAGDTVYHYAMREFFIKKKLAENNG